MRHVLSEAIRSILFVPAMLLIFAGDTLSGLGDLLLSVATRQPIESPPRWPGPGGAH